LCCDRGNVPTGTVNKPEQSISKKDSDSDASPVKRLGVVPPRITFAEEVEICGNIVKPDKQTLTPAYKESAVVEGSISPSH
jgi:hypothetical protein